MSIPYRVQLWKVPPPAFFEFGLESRCSVKLGNRISFFSVFLAMVETDPKGEKRGFLSLQPSPLGHLPPSLGERGRLLHHGACDGCRCFTIFHTA